MGNGCGVTFDRSLHQLHQLLVAADHVVFDFVGGDPGEELAGTVDAGGLDLAEFE